MRVVWREGRGGCVCVYMHLGVECGIAVAKTLVKSALLQVPEGTSERLCNGGGHLQQAGVQDSVGGGVWRAMGDGWKRRWLWER